MRKLFSVLVFICLLTACSSDDDPISYGNPSVELSTEETEKAVLSIIEIDNVEKK